VRTIGLYSGLTQVEESEEIARIAASEDATDAKRVERDDSLEEAVITEAKAAVRWVSEISQDFRRAIVVATSPDGGVVLSFMRSTSPHKAPSAVHNFKLSSSEAATLRELLNNAKETIETSK
jgi:hypothetical protein